MIYSEIRRPKRMDGTETRSLATNPEVLTKVNVSQIMFKFRAFIISWITVNHPPCITIAPTLFSADKLEAAANSKYQKGTR